MSSAAVSSGQSPGHGESSGPVRVEFVVRGMTCAACAAKVESRLNAIENVSATVNIATEKATVTAPSSIPVRRLVEEIERAGYGAEVAGARDEPAGAGGDTADAARVAYLRRRLIVALVFFVPLGDLSVLLSLFPAYRFPGWQWVLVARPAAVGRREPDGNRRGTRPGDETGAKEHTASCLE
jgi:P-type Cu+ transporter